MAGNNKMADSEARRLIGAGQGTAPPAVDASALSQSISEGTMARGSYRPSKDYVRLWKRAVSNDDGSPITVVTDDLLWKLLAETQAQNALLRDMLARPALPPAKTWRKFTTPILLITGIGTAVAYADGDAFGTGTVISPLPKSGYFTEIRFFDLDDEGLGKELAFWQEALATTPTDNVAFDPSDPDLHNCKGHINIAASDFANWGSNRMGTAAIPNKEFEAPEGILYGYFITRGADNIAAANLPAFQLVGWTQEE